MAAPGTGRASLRLESGLQYHGCCFCGRFFCCCCCSLAAQQPSDSGGCVSVCTKQQWPRGRTINSLRAIWVRGGLPKQSRNSSLVRFLLKRQGRGALNVNKQKHNNMPPWFMIWPLSLKLLTRVLATTISALFIASAPRLTNNKMKTMWLAGQYGSYRDLILESLRFSITSPYALCNLCLSEDTVS